MDAMKACFTWGFWLAAVYGAWQVVEVMVLSPIGP